MECPFCGWKVTQGDRDAYEMMLVGCLFRLQTKAVQGSRLLTGTSSKHVETLHSEGDSPFMVKDDQDNGRHSSPAAKAEELLYAECEVEGCGEFIHLDQLDYHLELHSDETGGDHAEALEKEKASSSSTPSRSNREAERERHRRSGRDQEAGARQSTAISFWKNLLRMPHPSRPQHRVSKHRHDHKPVGTETANSRWKRLGVGSDHPSRN